MSQSTRQVCILSAGCGTRMGPFATQINKGLIPYQNKAIISHVIELFPDNFEFIVAVGFKANQVRNYLKAAHPKLNIKFVEIDNFTGFGSGPGYSLSKCKQALRDESFYFVCNDSVWPKGMDLNNNCDWMAVTENTKDSMANYSNVILKNDLITEINNKYVVENKKSYAFTGLAHIQNVEKFWLGLNNESNQLIQNEKQVLDGFAALKNEGILKAIKCDWLDLGTFELYIEAMQQQSGFDFSKSSEFIYLLNNRVIKFFEDPKIAESRYKKSLLRPDVFPQLDFYSEQFYAYPYQPGQTLYVSDSENVGIQFISWLNKKLWTDVKIDSETMHKACKSFYYDKTLQRLALYEKKYPLFDSVKKINGKWVPPLRELLEKIDWNELYNGQASFIHGDLQPDNIIYNIHTQNFLLLDWRQDFSGHIEFGDIYYDFAKLKGGLHLDYSKIKKGQFSYSQSGDECQFNYPSHASEEQIGKKIDELIMEKKLSVSHANLLIPLIYINMAPLHHAPFDQLLYYLGRYKLHNSIIERNN